MLSGHKDKGWQGWIEDLADRITIDISKKEDDALDGDETEFIGRMLWLELDLRQGNLTNDEYKKRKALLERGNVW
jgi:hypothetical protein